MYNNETQNTSIEEEMQQNTMQYSIQSTQEIQLKGDKNNQTIQIAVFRSKNRYCTRRKRFTTSERRLKMNTLVFGRRYGNNQTLNVTKNIIVQVCRFSPPTCLLTSHFFGLSSRVILLGPFTKISITAAAIIILGDDEVVLSSPGRMEVPLIYIVSLVTVGL